ncbi:MAG: hypothetical protein ACRC31_00645, partial [Cetobacterium sp.]
ANDFILANNELINAVCAQNKQQSTERFKVVACTHKTGTFPDCVYIGNALNTKIKLGCEGGQPVKYIGPVA